jgi:uroporphyrinogen-III decarboxylase
MLRVHNGFFLTLGVRTWDRFTEAIRMTIESPDLVRSTMALQAEFTAALTDRILGEVEVDAAIFSEPIGGNDRALISPRMYEDLVLPSYAPVFEVLDRHGVTTRIFRTYANARVLIPTVVRGGFNALWACEVDCEAMDYRDIRREFGRDLALIGGIDLDALRGDRETIRREVEERTVVCARTFPTRITCSTGNSSPR